MRMEIKSHRDLIVWQDAMKLVEEVYRISMGFPSSEIYGLTSQLRRASVSIPANIAEAHGRGTRKDYAGFIAIAKGSALETSTLIELALRLKFTSAETANPLLARCSGIERMLGKLHQRLTEVKQPPHNA
jgi:four helix bundle protein